MEGKDNKCPRCNEWHQKLFHYYDNLDEKESVMCLSCLAELVTSRISPEQIEYLTYLIVGTLQDKLEQKEVNNG